MRRLPTAAGLVALLVFGCLSVGLDVLAPLWRSSQRWQAAPFLSLRLSLHGCSREHLDDARPMVKFSPGLRAHQSASFNDVKNSPLWSEVLRVLYVEPPPEASEPVAISYARHA